MNQQPDKLFREKLEGFQKPVPASAWDNIETNLDRKSRKGLWWKIAASLILLAIATYLLWPTKSQSTENSLATKKSEEIKSVPAPKEEQVKKALPSPVQNSVTLVESSQRNSIAQTNKEKEQPKELNQESTMTIEESVANVETPLNEITPTAETKTEVTEVVAVNTNTTTEKTDEYITLIVTADEANKYLTKNTNTQATTDDKKTSSLRKLLKKASDLTNDQRPLADLRQKKDEILALNFDSKKQRGQNK